MVHRAPLRVTFPSGQSLQLQMHDFSETGLFVKCEKEHLPEMDDRLQIQSMEIEDAPVLTVRVVRIIPEEGFAVGFI